MHPSQVRRKMIGRERYYYSHNLVLYADKNVVHQLPRVWSRLHGSKSGPGLSLDRAQKGERHVSGALRHREARLQRRRVDVSVPQGYGLRGQVGSPDRLCCRCCRHLVLTRLLAGGARAAAGGLAETRDDCTPPGDFRRLA